MAAPTVIPSITHPLRIEQTLKRKIGYKDAESDELSSTQNKLRCLELGNVNQGVI